MTLADLCSLVAGRVPLVVELKSHFDGDRKLVGAHGGGALILCRPRVGMSFDPDQVLALREIAPNLPRGIVAERHYDDEYWKKLTTGTARRHARLCGMRSAPAAFRRLLGQPAAGARARGSRATSSAARC